MCQVPPQAAANPFHKLTYSIADAGNFFFAGARIFFKSLEGAIFMFSRVARIPEGSLVLPAICTEERITLGAQLSDGTIIRGQNEISHPAAVGKSNVGVLREIGRLRYHCSITHPDVAG